MGRKLLFSPVGGTDPVKYFRDGSMLHICRHYRPDMVYLYLSHEMMEYHRKDNRYLDAIGRLGRHLNHTFKVELIVRDDLTEVQQYDVFYRDFREAIRKMEKEMKAGDELLLNMASGTPAMKSALLVMATLAEYRFKPIQVSTPQRKMNAEHEDRESYDGELYWELNQDNEEDAPNRCSEVECLNLMKMFQVDTVKKHVMAYDYTAALSMASEVREEIPEDAYRLLRIADARVKLQGNKISKLMAGRSYDIFPVKEGNKRKIFEYALVLHMKIEKQEYADFIRGITPLVVDLLENILKSECGIALEECCTERKKDGVMYWNRGKLKRAGLLELLDAEYAGGFKEGPVYSHHIAKIIQGRSNDRILVQKVKEINAVESAVRNVAAHEIVSVTDCWFRQETGKTAQEIFALLQYLTGKAGIQVKKEDWESYRKMNEKIVWYLR